MNKKVRAVQYAMRFIPDKLYLQLYYMAKFRKPINFKNPKTFNEKMQWLKIYDRRPEYQTMVDKYEVKKYVAGIIGEEHIIPTLGVWDRFEDIDFESLPDQFVLKCTHDSGGLVICKDKKTLDVEAARKKITDSLKTKYFYVGREWPYKNVKPRIIAEKYMVDESNTELKDYKVFNCDGEPKIIQVDYGRFSKHMRNLYSADWEHIEANLVYASDNKHDINRPDGLQEMLDLARQLSEKIPFVRTDFYSIEDKIYFGEITFFPESGFAGFSPESIGLELGNCITLPNIRGGVLYSYHNWHLLLRAADGSVNEDDLRDYKFMCFDGKVKGVFVCSERHSDSGLKTTWFDTDWNELSVEREYPKSDILISPPSHLEEMIYIAEQLSQGIPFVRVDLYQCNGTIYFGEMTFFPGGGTQPFRPEEWDYTFGSHIKLPSKRRSI